MIPLHGEPGSYRDPGSRVFIADNSVVRVVFEQGAADYEAVRDSGLLSKLISSGKLPECREVDPASYELAGRVSYVLEHPKLPFISYPYEWPFSLLKKAALFHLDLQLEALDSGFTLSDATAYNVQFQGAEPIFIDHLSFRPYFEGEIWAGHRQFCMQFLNPIILWSRCGIAPNAWFRGGLEGITPEDLSRLLRWRDNLSFTILSHVTGQAALQRRANQGRFATAPAKAKLSRQSFKAMLEGLRVFIDSCSYPDEKTVWRDYAGDNSYSESEAVSKRQFVGEMVAAVQPGLMFDLGCNSGDYSALALEEGARQVVGFDYDFGALEAAARRSESGEIPFLPLWLDAANPSPSQGWDQRERKGLNQRAGADALVALAFVHHIAIGRNVPLGMVLDWLIGLAPVGVIEFPPKQDPMVKQLLANRPDIFPHYTEEEFLRLVEDRAKIVKVSHLSKNGRLLLWYDRSQPEPR